MCRFLLARSKKKIRPKHFLLEFAKRCRESRSPDGDRQGDGWGIAYKYQISTPRLRSGQAIKNQKWILKKSLRPIWESTGVFADIPQTNIFAVHARSSGFPRHKGNISYNQPYVEGSLCFVFNGMIRGVRLARQVSGEIGAQKIFSLLQDELSKNTPDVALRILDKVVLAHSRKVEGMNIGLVKDGNFYVLCEYSVHKSYFTIHYHQDKDLILVCSEPIGRLGKYRWSKMEKGQVRHFTF